MRVRVFWYFHFQVHTEASLIKMGFPTHLLNGPLTPCLCHLEKASLEKITADGYFCPQCNSKYCELPVTCQVCGLTLVKAPHLARSYYHLFPLPAFTETLLERSICVGCQSIVTEKVYSCPKCTQHFCLDCDLYIHETLHNCPGCL
ncbi:General transcription factor IIH subunit 2 [Geodia barretti]|uniref:General transcription factor IIH subunit 2 n=1 Tax=Geodia barretti TaxID=519541 RepID=A0AA35XMI0_GEOBA|nr:General transcription factor IIH subunit 2 [Geodia barretti]